MFVFDFHAENLNEAGDLFEMAMSCAVVARAHAGPSPLSITEIDEVIADGIAQSFQMIPERRRNIALGLRDRFASIARHYVHDQDAFFEKSLGASKLVVPTGVQRVFLQKQLYRLTVAVRSDIGTVIAQKRDSTNKRHSSFFTWLNSADASLLPRIDAFDDTLVSEGELSIGWLRQIAHDLHAEAPPPRLPYPYG